MTRPITALWACPTGSAAFGIDQMKLTTITMAVIRQQTLQHLVGISTLFKPLKTTNPQIRIGVSLGSHSPHPRTDMGNSGTNS